MGLLYNIGVTWARVAFRVFGRLDIEGRDLIPRKGPLIVVANHQSNADPPLVAVTMPRTVMTMGKRELFANKLSAAIFTGLAVYPIGRDGRDVKAVKWAIRTLSEGKAVAIFPEATRSPGKLKQANPGVAYIAAKSGAPVLPLGIMGTEKIPSLWRLPFPLCRIKVRIGEPFTLPPPGDKLDRQYIEQATRQIMLQIAELLPEEYRGVYSLKYHPGPTTSNYN